jgi:hypothetical protein
MTPLVLLCSVGVHHGVTTWQERLDWLGFGSPVVAAGRRRSD